MKDKSSEKPTNGVPRRWIASTMAKLPTLSLVIAILLAVCVFQAIHPRTVGAQKKLPPGLEPYTPTKIEWMTLECQAALQENSYSSLEVGRYGLFINNPDSETILISVKYRPEVRRDIMNVSIDAARTVIRNIVKRHGWEGWIKISEEVEMVK